MSVTTYGDINQRTAMYAVVEMLKHVEPVVVLNKFGMSKPMPKNKADTVAFRRPIPFPAATVPLQEGVTPAGRKMSYENVTTTLSQYGDYVEISDFVHDVSEDPVLKDSAMLCGEQAAATVEQVTYGVVRGGTAVTYANGATRSAVNTPISLNNLRLVVRTLMTQKAHKISRILDSSPKYETRAVEASYVAVSHTHTVADVRTLAGFTPTAEYGQRSTLCDQEVGAVEDVRFVASPDLEPWPDAGGAKGSTVSTSGTSSDVYPIMVLGKDAYGTVPLKGFNSIAPKVLNPSVPRGGDPLGQRGTVGWLTYFTAVRLNEAWMNRLEVAVSDLSA